MLKRKDEIEAASEAIQEILRRDAERDGLPIPPKSEPEKMNVRVEVQKKARKTDGKSGEKALSSRKPKAIATRRLLRRGEAFEDRSRPDSRNGTRKLKPSTLTG